MVFRAALLLALSAPRGAASFQPLIARRLSSRCRYYNERPGLRHSGSGPAAVHNPTRHHRSAAFLSASAGSSSEAASVDAASFHPGKMYGGDYAGLSATFSPSTGNLIRVPEHLVPDSLIEWGQVPSCLEVLTSEDFVPGEEGGSSALKRKIAAVMPAVGCGVDNLDTMRTEETFGGVSVTADADDSYDGGNAAAMSRSLPPLRDAERIKIEAAFSLPPETETVDDGDEGGAAEASYPCRIRVTCDVVPATRTVSSPITVVRERRTSDQSTGGTIGLGGGLDGRTVMRLVGKANVNKPFAENMEGADDIAEREGFTTLSLPGDVVVRFGVNEEASDKWTVDMGLLLLGLEGGDDKKEGESRTLSVVRRVFSAQKSSTFDCVTELVTENC